MSEHQIPYESFIFNLAYNMMGSYVGAQDVLQDMRLKFLEKRFPADAPKAYYARATVHHCLNIIRKQDRTAYPGPWLPEPFVHAATGFETKDLLRYELAALVENLAPQERAVFVLREAMDFSHREIADVLELSTENSRQIYARARKKLKAPREASPPSAEARRLAQKLVELITAGEAVELAALFSREIKMISDGGRKVQTARLPVVGAEKVTRFLINISKFAPADIDIRYTNVLSQPAIAFFTGPDCRVVWILSLDTANQQIQRIYAVANPDKLNFMH